MTRDGVAPLLPFDLTTLAGARQPLSDLEQKLAQLSEQRGVIGAFQTRLGTALSSLSSAGDNLAQAASRIRDVDVAEESANLVRAQILQQAATAMLAQANQQPASILQLLI